VHDGVTGARLDVLQPVGEAEQMPFPVVEGFAALAVCATVEQAFLHPGALRSDVSAGEQSKNYRRVTRASNSLNSCDLFDLPQVSEALRVHRARNGRMDAQRGACGRPSALLLFSAE
jgi:hypothetical protein